MSNFGYFCRSKLLGFAHPPMLYTNQTDAQITVE
jgi:hypothetical protein